MSAQINHAKSWTPELPEEKNLIGKGSVIYPTTTNIPEPDRNPNNNNFMDFEDASDNIVKGFGDDSEPMEVDEDDTHNINMEQEVLKEAHINPDAKETDQVAYKRNVNDKSNVTDNEPVPSVMNCQTGDEGHVNTNPMAIGENKPDQKAALGCDDWKLKSGDKYISPKDQILENVTLSHTHNVPEMNRNIGNTRIQLSKKDGQTNSFTDDGMLKLHLKEGENSKGSFSVNKPGYSEKEYIDHRCASSSKEEKYPSDSGGHPNPYHETKKLNCENQIYHQDTLVKHSNSGFNKGWRQHGKKPDSNDPSDGRISKNTANREQSVSPQEKSDKPDDKESSDEEFYDSKSTLDEEDLCNAKKKETSTFDEYVGTSRNVVNDDDPSEEKLLDLDNTLTERETCSSETGETTTSDSYEGQIQENTTLDHTHNVPKMNRSIGNTRTQISEKDGQTNSSMDDGMPNLHLKERENRKGSFSMNKPGYSEKEYIDPKYASNSKEERDLSFQRYPSGTGRHPKHHHEKNQVYYQDTFAKHSKRESHLNSGSNEVRRHRGERTESQDPSDGRISKNTANREHGVSPQQNSDKPYYKEETSDEKCHDCKSTQDEEKETSASDECVSTSHNVVNYEGPSKENLHDHEDTLEGRDKYSSEREETLTSRIYFEYQIFGWSSYIRSWKSLISWDDDSKDPFERAISNSFGNQKEKEFYCDLTPYSHLDKGSEIRGWEKGDYVYIVNNISDIANRKHENHRLRDTSEEGEEMDSDIERTGTRPKNHRSYDQGNAVRYEEKVRKNHDNYNDGHLKNDEFEESNYNQLDQDFQSEPQEFLHISNEDKFKSYEDTMREKMMDQSRQSNISLGPDPHRSYHSQEVTAGHGTFPVEDIRALMDYLSLQTNLKSDLKGVLGLFPSYESVRKLVNDNAHVFSMNGDKVQLTPKVALCSGHVTSVGCQNTSTCRDLHICNEHILGSCDEADCIKGHRIHTTHNRKVLCEFYMEKLEPPVILRILQLTILGSIKRKPLDVCQNYNFNVCKSKNCQFLHICCDYVGGLGICCRPQCSLNHDLRQKNCPSVLQSYDIDISVMPEDESLFAIGQESHKIRQLVQGYGSHNLIHKTHDHSNSSHLKYQSQATSVGTNHSSSKKTNALSPMTYSHVVAKTTSQATIGQVYQDRTSVAKGASSSSNSKLKDANNYSADVIQNHKSSTNDDISISNQNSMAKLPGLGIISKVFNLSKRNNQPNFGISGDKILKTFVTVWSSYDFGDVEIPEICYHALNGVCKFESLGCKRLHAKQYFHWQFKPRNSGWINLQPHQVFHLEQSYANPLVNSIQLPPCSLTDLPVNVHAFLNRDKWYADFQDTGMSLVNTSNNEFFHLRRLSVQIMEKTKKYSNFLWYFNDINNSWVLYGKTDSLGMTQCTVNITSLDIEKRFANGAGKFKFSNNGNFNHYTIDFKTRTQTNDKTGVVRYIRRRPKLLPSKGGQRKWQ